MTRLWYINPSDSMTGWLRQLVRNQSGLSHAGSSPITVGTGMFWKAWNIFWQSGISNIISLSIFLTNLSLWFNLLSWSTRYHTMQVNHNHASSHKKCQKHVNILLHYVSCWLNHLANIPPPWRLLTTVAAPHRNLPCPSLRDTTANGLGWLLYASAPGGGHQGGRGTTAAAMVVMCVWR